MLSVTALCTTRNRRVWLPQAIRCFLSQTYPASHLKMVIVADGESIADIVPRDPRITLCVLPDEQRVRVLGIKKNIGVAFAATDLVCMFDDDDWSAPTRVADQVSRIESTGKQVTGYRSMLFTDGKVWWRYNGERMFALGTSLCFYKSWWKDNMFEGTHIGSDNLFVNVAAGCRQLAPAEGEELMVASNHPDITNAQRLQTDKRSNCIYMPVDFKGPAGYKYMSAEDDLQS